MQATGTHAQPIWRFGLRLRFIGVTQIESGVSLTIGGLVIGETAIVKGALSVSWRDIGGTEPGYRETSIS